MLRGDNKAAAEALLKTPLFAGIAVHDCANLAKLAVPRECVAGEILFSENEPAGGLLVLARGTLRLRRRTSTGEEIVVGEESAPCCVITPGLFDGGSNCVTAMVIDDAAVYVLLARAFRQFCRTHPEVLLRLLGDVSRRIRQTCDFIDLVTVGSIRQRLARALLDLVDDCGQSSFHLPCSQSSLALCIGTVREVVFRHLKQLQAEGVLHSHGSEIVIDDIAELQAVAGARIGAEHVFGPHATPSIPAYIASKGARK